MLRMRLECPSFIQSLFINNWILQWFGEFQCDQAARFGTENLGRKRKYMLLARREAPQGVFATVTPCVPKLNTRLSRLQTQRM